MIKERVRSGVMSGIKIPELRGHVKIRLYNPNTWKQEIIEGDNLITNALRDIFASNFCGVMKYNDMLPLYSKMLGGVLCFEGKLDATDPDDYFIPDGSAYGGDADPASGGNTLIAHAGQTPLTSQADDITRGNPSDTRVTITDGVVSLAWEWASTAGNGLIKSIALTHSDVGDAGIGSNSAAFAAMSTNINANYGLTPTKIVYFIDADGYGYNMTISGSTLTLTRFPMAYKKVGLVGIPYNYVSGIQEVRTISLGFSGVPLYCFDKSTSKLYLFYNSWISNSAEVCIADLSDWDNIPSPTHETWSLDENVGPLTSTVDRFCNLPILNGYVYLPQMTNFSGDTTGFLRVKINSHADQTFITGVSGKMLSGVYNPNAAHRVIAGKSFVINNGVLYKTAITSPDWVYTWAGDNRTVHSNLDQGDGLVGLTCTNNGAGYYPSVSKFYLASKFNLPTPVQKSNTQNMVVTYTLTEVGEES